MKYRFNYVYLDVNGLRKYGNTRDKIKTITCHVLQGNNIDAIKEKQCDMTASMCEQDGESDSEDDYVVGTFGSDSE